MRSLDIYNLARGSILVVLSVPLAPACGDDGDRATQKTMADSAETTTGNSPTLLTAGAASSAQPESETEFENGEPDAQGAECSIYAQDCDDGDKCVPWSDMPDLTPDNIRCCPVIGGAPGKQPGDACTVEGYFGSCMDDCDVGSFCLDIDDDGQGVCQAICTGTPSNPQCENGETCFVYFEGTPLCFPTCDPLQQDCADGYGCYPDEAADGGTGFICLPTVGETGAFNDYCWLLSNCQRGYMCATPDYLPDCDGIVGCCTPICNTDDEDSCGQVDSALECVSWYANGQTAPVAYESVGICILPP